MPADPDAHVELTSGDVSHLQVGGKTGPVSIDLGPLKNNLSDQNYDLPAAADLTKHTAVVIYSKQTDSVFSLAKLEPL